MGARKHQYGQLECMAGNTKLADDTLVTNFGTSKECPAFALGLCWTCKHERGFCYDLQSELRFPNVLAFHERQGQYWSTHNAHEISNDFIQLISRKQSLTNWVRFSQGSDIQNQENLEKLMDVSARVYGQTGVKFYGYTARSDLDYSNFSANNLALTIKGSSWDGPNGRTTVYMPWQSCPDGFFDCPADCRKCNACKIGSKNIAFKFHGSKAIMNKINKLHRKGLI